MDKSHDWDARTYHAVASPQETWGRRVLEWLALRGDEVVLDAGCGSGRMTRVLLERLPRGRVYGVDRSPAMLAVAREELAPFGERVRLLEGDLTTVDLPERVDAVFSNATLHWIRDHAALFRNLARLMRPGGRLAAQCGGRGNIAALRREVHTVAARDPFRAHLAGMAETWRFAGPEETADLLRAAGFTDIETGLDDAPQDFPDRDAYAVFIRTAVLLPFLEQLPADTRDGFVEAVATEAESTGRGYVADYVRLNMRARRA
jgi:trans-aconitate 2-methyltransferase